MKTIILYLVLIVPILSFAQVEKRDILFIKYDSLFFKKIERRNDNKTIYFIRGTGNSGTLRLEIATIS